MRRAFTITVAILAGFLFQSCFASSALADEFSGRVVSIQDGDTIEVIHAGRAERVRLLGIDCPEKGQAFGRRAKEFTADLVYDREVLVKPYGRDRNGRMIAEVFLADGRNLNRELVKAGFAWWFKRYSRDESMGRLEAEARAAKRGLWAEPLPTAPWEFRKRPSQQQ